MDDLLPKQITLIQALLQLAKRESTYRKDHQGRTATSLPPAVTFTVLR